MPREGRFVVMKVGKSPVLVQVHEIRFPSSPQAVSRPASSVVGGHRERQPHEEVAMVPSHRSRTGRPLRLALFLLTVFFVAHRSLSIMQTSFTAPALPWCCRLDFPRRGGSGMSIGRVCWMMLFWGGEIAIPSQLQPSSVVPVDLLEMVRSPATPSLPHRLRHLLYFHPCGTAF